MSGRVHEISHLHKTRPNYLHKGFPHLFRTHSRQTFEHPRYIHIHTHAHIQNTHAHTYTHTHTHTHTRLYTQTHTCRLHTYIYILYICIGFALVVELFNKDDAEDGGLSFFYSAETQSTN